MTSGNFQSVPVDSIWVDRTKRQRRELTDIEDLAASIAKRGLINPPVVKRDGELVAGERRWTAVKLLGWTAVPVQFTDELNEIELHLVEYEENVKRQDLTWQEQCAAVAGYEALQRSLDPEWNSARTAEALGMTPNEVGQKLAVAKEIASGNETIAKADKYSIARGLVERKQERAKASALDRLAATVTGEAPPERKAPLILADFHEWMLHYEGPKFNFIHCDFPYGVAADQQKQGNNAINYGTYSDTEKDYDDLLIALDVAMGNVVAESAHLMFWFSMTTYAQTFDDLTDMGWTVNPWPLVWVKDDNTGLLPDAKRGPRQIYETCFIASRGDRLIVRATSNAFSHPGKDKSIHMSEKPVPMLKRFMGMFVDEYSSVLDPTCGSGNALKAATALGAASVLGIERDPAFFALATEHYFKGDDDEGMSSLSRDL